MATVEIYASMWCGFCHRAKALLGRKGISWTEYDVDASAGLRREMQERGGGRTVPQIFIDGRPIGGCDELHALDRQGRLDALLGLTPSGDDSSGG